MVDDEFSRDLPTSEIDMQMMMTNPVWGRDVPSELKDKLAMYSYYKDSDGKVVVDKTSLWGLLGYYTRDIRLGNLGEMNGEMAYCQYYLDLAGDCLRENYINGFLVALSRAVTRIELSQSKKGFLRKLFGTIRQEHYTELLEPNKSKIFGGKGKNEGRE